jgi:hypothetical protein
MTKKVDFNRKSLLHLSNLIAVCPHCFYRYLVIVKVIRNRIKTSLRSSNIKKKNMLKY